MHTDLISPTSLAILKVHGVDVGRWISSIRIFYLGEYENRGGANLYG